MIIYDYSLKDKFYELFWEHLSVLDSNIMTIFDDSLTSIFTIKTLNEYYEENN